MTKLIVKNVAKHFDSVDGSFGQNPNFVIEKVNLSIEEGQFVCFVGPTGCGKTTLVHILAGLVKPTEGEVILNGHPVMGTGPDKIMVFQENALFPWLKVIDNVEFGLNIAGIEKKRRREMALHYLDMMQLTKFASAFIHQLSGGMKQRVAIARALIMDPEVLLMDEPFVALDAQTRELLLVELQLLWDRTKKTIVFVTHDVTESVCLGDKIVVFSGRPGRVKKEIHIDYRRPRLPEDTYLSGYRTQVLEELRTGIMSRPIIGEKF